MNGKKNRLKFGESFTKNNSDNSDKGYIVEVDVEHPKKLKMKHNDLPFLSERMKIKKFQKLACNLYDKENYVEHIRTIRQALNHGLVWKKVHRLIKFNQNRWLKP